MILEDMILEDMILEDMILEDVDMITFLPYPDFVKSVACLDNKRLNRQIMEAKIMYDIIIENRTHGGWVNHPATRMWRNYPEALAMYINACLDEWKKRGGHHSTEKIKIKDENNVKMPSWLGDDRIHSSHRSNLLRKDAFYYEQFGWTEGPGDPYYWPV